MSEWRWGWRVSFARDEVPDIRRHRAFAEGGSITPGNDDVRAADPADWDRATRVVYNGTTNRVAYDGTAKWEWDGEDLRRTFDLAVEEPCRQQRDEDSTAPPRWARDRFASSFEEPHAGADDVEDLLDDIGADGLLDLGDR